MFRLSACRSGHPPRLRWDGCISIHEPHLASPHSFVSLYAFAQNNIGIFGPEIVSSRGQKIRVVSTAVSGQSKIRTMRSEVREGPRSMISYSLIIPSFLAVGGRSLVHIFCSFHRQRLAFPFNLSPSIYPTPRII